MFLVKVRQGKLENFINQSANTCSNVAMEILEQGVEYVQS